MKSLDLWLQAKSWGGEGWGCYGYDDDKSVDGCCLTHFNACKKYDKVRHSPFSGSPPPTATRIVCVSSPSCAAVEEATSCSFESRILKEKRTTLLVVMHYSFLTEKLETSSSNALPKKIQRHPIKGKIWHPVVRFWLFWKLSGWRNRKKFRLGLSNSPNLYRSLLTPYYTWKVPMIGQR